jgi:hypothetical protein
MLVFTIVLSIFIIEIAVIGVVFYIFWKKWGKKMFNLLKTTMNLTNFGENQSKLPKLNDFQKEISRIQEMLQKNYKK